MKVELPLELPLKEKAEKIMVLGLFIFVFAMAFGFIPSSVQRIDLINKIPPTETDASFLIGEVYNKTHDIDMLLLGPCTVWWQLYTPYLQERLSEKTKQQAEVITLGFNHFGSDVMYLILLDLLQKRKVKNLVLALPKTEDLYAFPHQNSVNWWIYPKDLDDVDGLSIYGYGRILSLNLFTSLYRKSLGPIEPSSIVSDNRELGFHSARSIERLGKNQLPSLKNLHDLVTIVSPEKVGLDSNTLLSDDWIVFYKKILQLTKKNAINVLFVDSPHASDFLAEKKTVPGNFPQIFEDPIPVIATDFVQWQQSLPEAFKNRIIAGQNLTVIGAQLFTDLIGSHVVRLAK